MEQLNLLSELIFKTNVFSLYFKNSDLTFEYDNDGFVEVSLAIVKADLKPSEWLILKKGNKYVLMSEANKVYKEITLTNPYSLLFTTLILFALFLFSTKYFLYL